LTDRFSRAHITTQCNVLHGTYKALAAEIVNNAYQQLLMKSS